MNNLNNNFCYSENNPINPIKTFNQGNSEIYINNNLINKEILNNNQISNILENVYNKEEIIYDNNRNQMKIDGLYDNKINLSENSNFIDSNDVNNKLETKGKISIDMIVPTKTLNLLKKFQNNIYIEMENKYGCQITKRVEVN